MISLTETLRIGRLSRTHGIHGEMELQFTDDAFDRGSAPYLLLLLDGILVPFFWESYRFKNHEAALIRFEDLDNEAAARSLVGVEVYYPLSALPEGDVPSLRSSQGFVGFEILLPDVAESSAEAEGIATRRLGRVTAVNAVGESILFALATDEGEELLIPFHEDFLLHADLSARQLLLALPEGILELNA